MGVKSLLNLFYSEDTILNLAILYKKLSTVSPELRKSAGQAQRFLTVYGVVGNLFRLGRHLTRAVHYREFR